MIGARPSRVEDLHELGHYEGHKVHRAIWEKTCDTTFAKRATGVVVSEEVTRQDGEVGQQGADSPLGRIALAGSYVEVRQRDRVPRLLRCGNSDWRSNLLCLATSSVAARQKREHERTTHTVLAETRTDGEAEPTSMQRDCS